MANRDPSIEQLQNGLLGAAIAFTVAGLGFGFFDGYWLGLTFSLLGVCASIGLLLTL